ncbi:MAG: DUF433 domain-containing protein [Candidatus Nanohaloarchaea archaeon]|nr:DUF433 domain-containing protein [Candidatus Nanohaloarchaea archaeon]
MTIIKSENIRSGKPVIEGSRVAVGDVVERFFELDRSIEQIASDLGISKEGVEEALRYHHSYDHVGS